MIATALAVSLVLTRGCHETSDSQAVGFAHCRRFGMWDASQGPRIDLGITVGTGWSTLVPDSGGTNLQIGSGKTATTINSFAPGALGGGSVQMAEASLRFDIFRWGPLRGGTSFTYGANPMYSATATSPVGLIPIHAPTAWTAGLPAGVDLRWERVCVTADVTPALTSFNAGITNSVSLTRPPHLALVVGAAVRFWITPAIALEANGGIDVLEPDHLSAGLRLHMPVLNAFDGVDPVVG
jgi:hypothetical protein